MIGIYVNTNSYEVLATGQAVGQSVVQFFSLIEVQVQISSWNTNIYLSMYISQLNVIQK